MKIAIPTYDQKLCPHFGHCEKFALLQIEGKDVVKVDYVTPPPHEPGVLPKWLNEEHQVSIIIAGGMGQRAQNLFLSHNIEVIVGAPSKAPRELAESYLNGTLENGINACDH